MAVVKARRLFPILAVLLVALSLAATVSAANSPVQPIESWAVVEQGGKPVGFGVDQYFSSADGVRYVSDLTLQIEMMGTPGRVTQHIEQVADKNFQFKSFISVSDINGTRLQVKGELEGNTVKITTTTADGRDHVSSWEKPGDLYFDSSFTDSVIAAGGLRVGKSYRTTVISLATYSPTPFEMTVTKATTVEYAGKKVPVFEVVTKGTGGEVTSLMDENGITYLARSAAQNMVIRKIEKDRIPELESAAADVLIIPGNVSVTHPYRSTSSLIRFTWKDVAYDLFNLEDNRQKLVEHKESAGSHEVVVAIHRDTRDFTGKVKLPVADDSFKKYLTDSMYITPSSPEVKKLAAQIVGGETDAWKATQKLVDWVFNYIKPAMIPETLTTEQILRKKEGKCVEYAVLFASLARAAGLPTRLALGERYQDNMWIGHMWNEVWLGEWVTVDASHNQASPDALLLKFVHSDSVPGTQNVRIGLTGKLGIVIQQYELEPQTASQQLVTGIEGLTYSNADYRCQVTAPAGWIVQEASEQGMPMAIMQPAANPRGSAIVLMFSAPSGTRPQLILDSRLPMLQGALPGFTLISQEAKNVGSDAAAVGTWTFEQAKVKYRQQNWVVIHGDVGFLFVFTAPDAEWGAYEGAFGEIVKGFRAF